MQKTDWEMTFNPHKTILCVLCVLCVLCGFFFLSARAAETPLPKIAIIIDDIGDRQAEGERAVNLPGPVACAFLPHTPYAPELARQAHAQGKEVLLHLPLQALDHNGLLGPGRLLLDTPEAGFRRTVASDLRSIPHVVGVNNHMGSLLTQHPGAMAWLMSELKQHGNLFFVDSYTTPRSVALQIADEYRVPATRRDVFLDNSPEPEDIAARFAELIETARQEGHAVGIGHPRPATLDVLARELDRLEEYGVTLVPVSEIIRQREQERGLWHASSSPSPTAAKKPKPSPSSTCCAVQGSK